MISNDNSSSLQGDIYARKKAAFGELTALYGYTFKASDGSVPKLAEAQRYALHFGEMQRDNIGLLFIGPTGTGKTYAAACIGNALCDELMDVRMITLAHFLIKISAMTLADKDYYLNRLKNCDLLVVDDLGAERRTDYAQEQVFTLIDGRYLSHKPIIITSNLSIQDLKEPKDMTLRRIYSRILEMCVPVYFGGCDIRQNIAAKKMQLYKSLTRNGTTTNLNQA